MKIWILFTVLHGHMYPLAYYAKYADCMHAAHYIQTMGTDDGAECHENWVKP